MEILSNNSATGCELVSSRCKLIGRSSNSYRLEIPGSGKVGVVCSRIGIQFGSLGFSRVANLRPKKNRNHREGYRSPSSLGGIHKHDSKILRGCYNSYVAETEEDARRVTETSDPPSKILIPGLPDESKGEISAPVTSCYWEWKPKFNVHYEKAGCDNVNAPPVLFLPGFGVGSFHYEKQLKDLGRDYRVFALDFLGQGMSLPVEDPAPRVNSEGKDSVWGFGDQSEPWAHDLVYSVDLWRDQVQYFVEEVIGEPTYIVGNSLGGFVAVYFAACNPHLVKGVTLLNATPFWGFLPNRMKSPRLARVFPWAGTFPLPASVRKLINIVWQKISDPESIKEILEQVYADHSTKVDNVFSRILEITRHPAAAASFASIMFAPRGQLSFDEALSRCQKNNMPICLVYGKEDPWVRPVWGSMVKKQLPDVPYYEISPAGHCPHDEVPEVVNYLLRGWIKNLEHKGSVSLPLLDDPESMQYIIDRDLEFVREGSKKSVKVRYHGSLLSLWDKVSSFINSKTSQPKTENLMMN